MSRPGLPWRYPYQEDGPRLDSIVMRPIVPLTLVGVDGMVAPGALALVDSGCEHVLISQGLARSVGLDWRGSQRQIQLGIGGTSQTIRFLDAALRLHPDGGSDDEFIEWQAEVGVVATWRPTFQILLGQVGFLDQFTVTLSRHAREIAVDECSAYDRRFPPRYLRR